MAAVAFSLPGPKRLTHRSAPEQLHPPFFFRGHLWKTSGTGKILWPTPRSSKAQKKNTGSSVAT